MGEAEKLEESLTLLREARQLDPRNSVIRTVLVNSLLSVAVQKKDAKDWERAEPLIRELLEIQPNHPPAVSLLSQVGDQRQEEFVSWCLAQARRMQRQDDYDGALALVQQGLEADPRSRGYNSSAPLSCSGRPKLLTPLPTRLPCPFLPTLQGSARLRSAPPQQAFSRPQQLQNSKQARDQFLC